MSDDDTARLRALAEAAPKGPWTLLGAPDDAEPHLWTIVTADGLWTAREPVAEFHKLMPHGRALQAAAGRYIAAASPDVLLRLLDALDEARRTVDAHVCIEGRAANLPITPIERAVYWKSRAKSAEGKLRSLTYALDEARRGRDDSRAKERRALREAFDAVRERDAAMALLRECDEVATSLCGVADLARHGELFARIDAMLGGGV